MHFTSSRRQWNALREIKRSTSHCFKGEINSSYQWLHSQFSLLPETLIERLVRPFPFQALVYECCIFMLGLSVNKRQNEMPDIIRNVRYLSDSSKFHGTLPSSLIDSFHHRLRNNLRWIFWGCVYWVQDRWLNGRLNFIAKIIGEHPNAMWDQDRKNVFTIYLFLNYDSRLLRFITKSE